MTFDPNEARIPSGPGGGRWTTGGGGGDAVKRHLVDPRVTDVGGDEWNKKTAERLEKEYAAVRPEIDAIATEGVAVTPSDWKVVEHPDPLWAGSKFALQASDGTYGLNPDGVGVASFANATVAEAAIATYAPAQSLMEPEEEPDAAPKEWGDLSGSQQEEAEAHYKDSNLSSEQGFVNDNWYSEGGAMQAAKEELAQDDDFKSEFLSEFIADRIENDEARIPYNVGDLAGAINIKPGDEGDSDPEITFDEKYLDKPDNFVHEGQPSFPGIEPQNPADFLTPKMRDDIVQALTEKFNDDAKDKAGKMDPPDYLEEQAQENNQDAWDNMGEEEQFDYAKKYVDGVKDQIDNAGQSIDVSKLAWPAKFDPLNKTSGTDYQRTQALAKFIADRRGAQLITERTDAGIIGSTFRLGSPEFSSSKDWSVSTTKSGNIVAVNHFATKEEAQTYMDAQPTGGWKPRDKFLGDNASYEKLYGPGGVGAKKDAAWTQRMQGELQSADFKLWAGWKGSSTNADGRLLQVAASDELGGRIREAKQPAWKDPANDPEEVKLAKSIVGDASQSGEKTAASALVIAAYKDGAPPDIIKTLSAAAQGVKSPLTDKIIMDYFSHGAGTRVSVPGPLELDSENVNGYTRLPKVIVDKNGAASTTVSLDVANNWNGTTNNAPEGINKKESIAYANKEYAAIGGYEGVKAAMRAKWETTQYLLDKADTPVVDLYRGMKVEHILKGVADKSEFNAPYSGIVKEVGPFGEKSHDLAKMAVGDQIKTALGKTITKVSMTGGGYSVLDNKINFGKWEYDQPATTKDRIVLRAEIPRTAVISVPAYGNNLQSEQEVVVIGGAWKGWDAWSGRAPSFDAIPMGAAKAKKAAGYDKGIQNLYDELKNPQS
jgi:hypothetical protein